MAPIVTSEKTVQDAVFCGQSKNLSNEQFLTEDQSLLALLASMNEKGSLAYNNSTTLKLTGSLQLDKLKQAIYAVVRRHAVLRSTVSCDKKK